MVDERELRRMVGAAAAGRVAIGLASVFAPGPSSRLLGFPRAQDNPSARLMGGLFGVRDVALGVLVWRMRGDRALLRWAFRFNAAIDAGDMAAAAVPLVRRQGIDRAAASTAAFAFTGANLWLRLLRRTR